jgi:hypothetical protein
VFIACGFLSLAAPLYLFGRTKTKAELRDRFPGAAAAKSRG